jgi:hypothetical protein
MADRTRIAVFQPFFTEGAPLDVRLLGMQSWLARKLGEVDGVEAISMLGIEPGSEPKELLAFHPPTDAQIVDTLTSCAARLGLLMSFAVFGNRSHLVVARLVEVHAGKPRLVASWTFDGDNDQPAVAASYLFNEVLQHVGQGRDASTWQEMFGTTNPSIASNYLTALGCHASCEAGAPITQPQVALRAVLSGVIDGMASAIELFPALVAGLRATGSADDAMSIAAARTAIGAVTSVPPSWDSMLDELGLADPSLPN